MFQLLRTTSRKLMSVGLRSLQTRRTQMEQLLSEISQVRVVQVDWTLLSRLQTQRIMQEMS
jgi:hypothetical protein